MPPLFAVPESEFSSETLGERSQGKPHYGEHIRGPGHLEAMGRVPQLTPPPTQQVLPANILFPPIEKRVFPVLFRFDAILYPEGRLWERPLPQVFPPNETRGSEGQANP